MSAVRSTTWTQTVAVGMLGALVSFALSWRPAYWHDEAATLSAADRSLAQLWELLGNVGTFNSLYYFVMHGWVAILGDSEVATRSFSAIGIGVTCAATAQLGRRLAGRNVGLAAGLIAAVLPGLSWAGAETRVYAWNAATAVVATLFLVRAVDSGKPRDWVGYTVAMTLSGYLFLFSLLLLPAHLVTLAIQKRLQPAWWIAAAVVTAAIAPLLYFGRGESERVDYQEMGALEMIGKAGLKQSFLSTRADDGLGIALVCGVLLFLVALLLAAVTLRVLPRDCTALVVLSVTLPWAVLPTVALVGYSLLGSPIYQERYLTFCAPGVALLMGFGLMRLRSSAPIWLTICGLIVVLPIPILVQQKQEASRSGQDYRRLAEFVSTEASAVIFERAHARSLLVAYPDDFDSVTELNLLATPQKSNSYWGETEPPDERDAASVRGRRVALVLFTETRVQRHLYGQWLADQGCRHGGATGGTRLTVHIFDC